MVTCHTDLPHGPVHVFLQRQICLNQEGFAKQRRFAETLKEKQIEFLAVGFPAYEPAGKYLNQQPAEGQQGLVGKVVRHCIEGTAK